MKKNIYLNFFLVLFLFNNHFKAQYCTSDARFTETEVFTNSQINTATDIQYGTAIDYLGVTKNLTLNIFYPKLTVDPLPKRPLIFLVHGGGFINGSKTDLNEEAKLFAKRGYVSVTIDYRLGMNCSDPLSYNKAVYRALQDAHAAMRYVVSNASTLQIDTAWIFVGGQSAGSVTTFNLCYGSQAESDAFFPTFPSQFGLLTTSTNTLTTPFSIKGIYNNWGGVSSEFIKNDLLLPIVSFHGDADPAANIDSFIDSNCPGNAAVVKIYGSRTLHTLSVSKGVCSALTIEQGGGHGIYNTDTQGRTFRVSRASCFFKSLFCNTCISYSSIDNIIYPCSNVTSIYEGNLYNEHKLFPVPTKDKFSISGILDLNALEVEVINVYGKSVLMLKGTSLVDLSDYSSGVYFLKLKEYNIITTYKLLKE